MGSLQTRRELLVGVSALVIAAFGLASSQSVAASPKICSMGSLMGRKASDLYAIYIGFSGRGVLPKTLTIDFTERLRAMWEVKRGRSDGNGVVSETSATVIREYENLPDVRPLTVSAYRGKADYESRFVWDRLDWSKVKKMYFASAKDKFSDRRLSLLKTVGGRIRGRSLVAYALTELMPSADGEFNRDFLNFLLLHGGRAYVERIPALYDKYTSFGPYQFTSYALYGVAGSEQGASRMNLALPERHRIPGSVMLLRGNEHFKAAYLFALHNLACLIRRLSNKQLATFESVKHTSDASVTEFIATAHHAPALAMSAGERWLDNRAQLPYRKSCSGRIIIYARKTAANYRAV